MTTKELDEESSANKYSFVGNFKRPIDIDKTGVWVPWFSCFFLAYALTKNIAIIAAITE